MTRQQCTIYTTDLVEEPQLHEEYEAGHAEEHVGPEQHVDMVHKVNTEGGQLQHQLCVVGVGVSVLPGTIVVHVPQVDDIPVSEGIQNLFRQ